MLRYQFDQGDSGRKPTSSISNDGHLTEMHSKAFGRRTSRKEITLETWRLWNDNTKIYFRGWIKLIRESGPTDCVTKINLWTHLKKVLLINLITFICSRVHIYRGLRKKYREWWE